MGHNPAQGTCCGPRTPQVVLHLPSCHIHATRCHTDPANSSTRTGQKGPGRLPLVRELGREDRGRIGSGINMDSSCSLPSSVESDLIFLAVSQLRLQGRRLFSTDLRGTKIARGQQFNSSERGKEQERMRRWVWTPVCLLAPYREVGCTAAA